MYETPAPKANGSAIPVSEMAKLFRILFFNMRGSSSSPTRKRKRTRPKLDMRLRNGRDGLENIVSEKYGMWPMLYE